jgi:hypothetical protein
MHRSAALSLLAASALAVGCTATGASSPSGSAAPSGPADAANPLAFFNCHSADMRGPDGAPVTLDGTWVTDGGGTFDLRQSNGCLLFGSGTAPSDLGEAGQHYPDRRIVFAARMFPDFTILGWFSEIQKMERAPDSRPLQMVIEFVDAGDGSQHLRLTRIYDPPRELYAVIWHPLCFVPVADLTADGVVLSEMCPQPPSTGIPPNQN